MNRGLAYASQNQFDKSIQDFQQALRLSPKDPRASAGLAKVTSRKREFSPGH
jgi:cytochrome c-type biogenesis protein CcmH/NrfG